MPRFAWELSAIIENQVRCVGMAPGCLVTGMVLGELAKNQVVYHVVFANPDAELLNAELLPPQSGAHSATFGGFVIRT